MDKVFTGFLPCSGSSGPGVGVNSATVAARSFNLVLVATIKRMMYMIINRI
jgi:hypothetical protein